jgi:hypothetical protein
MSIVNIFPTPSLFCGRSTSLICFISSFCSKIRKMFSFSSRLSQLEVWILLGVPLGEWHAHQLGQNSSKITVARQSWPRVVFSSLGDDS